MKSNDNSVYDDAHLWLEEVEGEKALQFARAENEKTLLHFRKDPLFKILEAENRQIILAKDRVPAVTIKNGELYNFWQDETHVRGLWRKTSIESYKSGKPDWNVLIDLDALAEKENENWVWKGSAFLHSTFDRAMIGLSRGGKDAAVLREFDVKARKFVEDGFKIPEAKGHASWKDKDTLYVMTDFGPGTMTTSGYARIVKKWKRGTPLSSAVEVHRVESTDMSAYVGVERHSGQEYTIHTRVIGFYQVENFYEIFEGKKVKIEMPLDSQFHGVFKGQALFLLQSDFKNFKSGSLVSMPMDKIVEGKKSQDYLQLLLAPTDKMFIEMASPTKNRLLIGMIDNILQKFAKADYVDGKWHVQNIDLGHNGMASLTSLDETSDAYIAEYVDFLQPSSVYLGNATDPKDKFALLSKSPERFDAKNMHVERFSAKSKDGTTIPYFLVSKKTIHLDGRNPTLMYGYGGFLYAMQPSYLSAMGKTWLERGGVYVLANLRGGGEFGPSWHQAVLKENRYKVYEDNIAIAEDLIARKITSPAHLAIKGGSNGGLLVGATMVLRPDLFSAVLCQVPLLDMLRYHKLLAGASWMNEYGDPDEPKMREAILKYSPYQRVRTEVKYPEAFFMTSTKDDRVHPGHARKMVAKMQAQGHNVFYYENIDGGHGRTANLEQSILWTTLEMTYLWQKIGTARN